MALGSGFERFCLYGSYHRGIGVPEDFEEARRWYTRAAAKGFEDAKAALALHWPA